ncbi:MAG: serine/threonine protein phosphatase [Saprospiraceae bacterium]|nr:serine/threonine protein phosphatase [Saprospiraceae bacterium]
MVRQYAISDLHGCSKTFTALLDKLALSTSDELYLLGDYVDRGPDSKGVLDTIFQLQKDGYQVQCLMGNHEELVLKAAGGDFTGLERWLLTDGKDTMDSFGVPAIAEIPDNYLNWMAALPYYLEVGNYLLVHAGLDFGLDNPLSEKSEMCWIRHWYDDIRYDWLRDRMIIHGHTPVFTQIIENQLSNLQQNKYLDIDSGCVFSHERFVNKDGLGFLCAFDMVNQTIFFQPNVDY